MGNDENTNNNAADTGQETGAPDTAANETPETTEEVAPLVWDEWFGEQGEPVQELINTHTAGLKSALDSERGERKNLQKQLKSLSQQAEEGSDLRASLDKLTADTETANARADFFEAASDPALGLRDAKLAWSILSANPDEFTRRGKPDFAALKEAHPILFEKPRSTSAPTNAGSGTRNPAPNKTANEQMNDFIRGSRG